MNWNKFDQILEKGVQILVASVIIVIPVYLKFPLFEVPGTYVFIRAEDFLIAALIGVWALWKREKMFELLFKNKLTQALAFFWMVTLFSSISAIFLTDSVSRTQVMLHYFRYVQYMSLLVVVMTSITDRKIAWWYMKLICLTLVMVFIYGWGQRMYGWPIISTMNREYAQGVAQSTMPGGRINSTFAGHYDLAAYVVMMLNLLPAIVVVTKKWGKLVPALLWAMAFYLMVVSASRISFAAYLVSIGITLVLLKKWFWIPVVYVLSIVSFFQTPELMNRYQQTFQYEFAPRLASIHWPWKGDGSGQIAIVPTLTPPPTPEVVMGNNGTPAVIAIGTPTPTPTMIVDDQAPEIVEIPEDRSTAIRFEVEWPRAIRAVTKNPAWGTGYSSITLATDNNFLRILGETGLIGLAGWLIIFGEYGLLIIEKMKSGWSTSTKVITYGIIGVVVGFMANALFIDVFAASKVAIYFWLLIGINIGFLETDKKRK